MQNITAPHVVLCFLVLSRGATVSSEQFSKAISSEGLVGWWGKVLSSDDKRTLVGVLSFCEWSASVCERDTANQHDAEIEKRGCLCLIFVF